MLTVQSAVRARWFEAGSMGLDSLRRIRVTMQHVCVCVCVNVSLFMRAYACVCLYACVHMCVCVCVGE